MLFHTAFVLNSREVVAVGVPSQADAKRASDVKLLGIKDGAPVVVEFSELGKTPYGTRYLPMNRGKVIFSKKS